MKPVPLPLPPFERLEDMVARQCARSPDAVAIECGQRAVTYRALDRLARGVERQVALRGIGPGQVVAIYAGRAPETIAAMLGVLSAGAAYVPVDPAQPVDRSALIMASARADLVLADRPLPASLGTGARVVDLRECAAGDADPPGADVAVRRDPGDLAYVLYTSGSSGEPKGVALAHQASRYVLWAQAMFTDGELARVAATTSIAFDPSVFEIYAPLATGGTVLLRESLLEPFGEDERPTLLQGVPSALLELARIGALPPTLRVLNIGGESLSPALCATIFGQLPACRIFNHYGPTEATICTSVFEVPREGGATPTLGHPICGARVLILDEDGAEVPQGTTGEIAIAGETLALGYHHRPDLTEERFVLRADGERVYLTGDLGERLEDGSLQFHGRLGDQVKINGVRIELAEVEAALLALPEVTRAGSAVHADATGRARLVAYLPSEFRGTLADLRVALRERLPLAMLPSALVRLDSFPLTATGKLDRKALPRPDFTPLADAAPEPRRPAEGDPAAAVAAVFAELLGLPAFSIDDDFFASGGDSLLAVQAALQLETVLERVIPAGLIAQVPTPRGIAGLLALQQPMEGYSHIVPLYEGGEGPTVFWTPDVHGQAISMMAIARAMDGPAYGLVPDPATLHGTGPVDFWALVRSYAEEIARFQPEGPCVVAGYSFGGPWAFGVAACLEALGRQAVLCLADPMNNLKGGLSVRRAYRFARITMGKVLGQRSLSVWRRLAGAAARRLADPAGLERGVPSFVPPGAREIAARLIAAVPAFRQGRFGGSTVVALSDRRPAAELAMDDDGLFGWRPLLPGPVRSRRFDATHRELAMQRAEETGRFLSAALVNLPYEASTAASARMHLRRS